jgi:hypothetical protein
VNVIPMTVIKGMSCPALLMRFPLAPEKIAASLSRFHIRIAV